MADPEPGLGRREVEQGFRLATVRVEEERRRRAGNRGHDIWKGRSRMVRLIFVSPKRDGSTSPSETSPTTGSVKSKGVSLASTTPNPRLLLHQPRLFCRPRQVVLRSKLWFSDDESLPSINLRDTFTGPEVTISEADIQCFCAIVGNDGESLKGVRSDELHEPMDFAIVTGWQVCYPADNISVLSTDRSFRRLL